jgi:predicted nuclease with TOPRIM domain
MDMEHLVTGVKEGITALKKSQDKVTELHHELTELSDTVSRVESDNSGLREEHFQLQTRNSQLFAQLAQRGSLVADSTYDLRQSVDTVHMVGENEYQFVSEDDDLSDSTFEYDDATFFASSSETESTLEEKQNDQDPFGPEQPPNVIPPIQKLAANWIPERAIIYAPRKNKR